MKDIEADIVIRPDFKAVALPPRRIPAGLEVKVKAKLQDLLLRGIIEVSDHFSPWQSPLVVAQKKSGDVRICVDLRMLNHGVLRQPQPFPSFEELSAKFFGANRFSVLDVQDAFHQVALGETSRDFTTFATADGAYRYTRLPFGLSSAPELFQRVMKFVLRGLTGVIWYLDDIIIFGSDDHDRNLLAVLQRLEEYGVRLNTAKCKFDMEEVTFIGYHISAHGICPSPEKVEALRNCRPPTNKSEAASFLGLVSYVGHCL
jgi:Reverse transcriptase (RNA-dependent DNA polymerase)